MKNFLQLYDLSRRVYIVTGCGGIGTAAALALVQQGAHVILAGRNPTDATAIINEETGLLLF
jgi:NAD(P)-dependent dehydrogenase (short-subunit alcohol dehydrogenase family)